MSGDCPLVSVVVPAYNAAETVMETLETVSGQTYRNLDIIVVDDGSTDQTPEMVQVLACSDPRIHLVRQANGGVAAARNAGLRHCRGDLIAFVDADDLWHPAKIEKQVAVLRAGGADMALVYCPHRVIDQRGHVVLSSSVFGADGWVLHRHFRVNLVGNGSAILARREAIERVGGFAPWLREAGAEGCEDLLLQLRMAARYRFGTVNEYLVGYRRRAGSMSFDTPRMIRSGILAITAALAENQHVPNLSASTLLNAYEWRRLKVAALNGHLGDALRIASRQIRKDPAFLLIAAFRNAWALAEKIRSRTAELNVREAYAVLSGRPSSRHFASYAPEEGIRRGRRNATARALARLASLDEAYRPSTPLAPPRGDAVRPGELPKPRAGSESVALNAP